MQGSPRNVETREGLSFTQSRPRKPYQGSSWGSGVPGLGSRRYQRSLAKRGSSRPHSFADCQGGEGAGSESDAKRAHHLRCKRLRAGLAKNRGRFISAVRVWGWGIGLHQPGSGRVQVHFVGDRENEKKKRRRNLFLDCLRVRTKRVAGVLEHERH